MIENPFYSPEFHGDYELVSIGRLDLEEGGTIPDCQLAVTTWGELNEARDNAILITTWYSGTHQIWRDVYVGPEHALNPERYFIVAINQIGNGLSTSPHNAAGTQISDVAGSRRSASATTSSPRNGCCASTSASSGCSSSSAGRWGPSRPTSGRSGSRTRCCAPRRSPAPRRTPRTTSSSPRRSTSRSGPTPAGTAASTRPTPTSSTASSATRTSGR